MYIYIYLCIYIYIYIYILIIVIMIISIMSIISEPAKLSRDDLDGEMEHNTLRLWSVPIV